MQDEKENQQNQVQFNNANTTANTAVSVDSLNTQTTQQQQQLQQQQQQQLPPLASQHYVQRNLFHFNGSRYISWLPSFSLQVTNGTNVLPSLLSARQVLSPERLNDMVRNLLNHLIKIKIKNNSNGKNKI